MSQSASSLPPCGLRARSVASKYTTCLISVNNSTFELGISEMVCVENELGQFGFSTLGLMGGYIYVGCCESADLRSKSFASQFELAPFLYFSSLA